MKVHKSLILLCVAMILQGCVGAVIVGTAAVATKTATDPRTIGTQVDDCALEARVSNALAKDQQLKKEAHIVNTVYQGKILLTGQAPTHELAERAKQIAMLVNGATEVYNEIRQGQLVSLRRTSMDIWITAKTRSQLLANAKVKSSNVKVTTENGEVFLLGMVNTAEGKAAAEVASKVNGVKRVITAFTYLQ
ncbi:division/outer membrane stress-associated lipid-binding lipoprotein [Sodalis endosymbiont of Henestaris halophilus]|uniref:division/outer membrane stress-associated lipid-binding lipoprotein n=1 Tax=Sodalis endosymbiont of Henestaris halophilus TaxID=1929246 RepID=UPI000BBFB5F4|nr:division/outer membrane stress-associated lipid-binding lipoprotein [Sodalis endosymbiont of Henestaris halophilus]SNC59039.1 Osmotically-inducible protein Y precursor [Sodalis endosymbiont of Henestaris halophilus]